MDLWSIGHVANQAKAVVNHLNSQISDIQISLISQDDPDKYVDAVQIIQNRVEQLEDAVLIWRRLQAEFLRAKQKEGTEAAAEPHPVTATEIPETPIPVTDNEIYF